MIKKLLFAAALMVPCLAYGADPSANLSVQVVPTGPTTSAQCGSPPPEAAQAGFTTMALCNDFTQPIPNTAGTGLPSTWLGLVSSGGGPADGNDHVWFQCIWYVFFCPPANETGWGLQQVTDTGVTPNALALLMGYSNADPNNNYKLQGMATSQLSGNFHHDYPIASLVEVTLRTDVQSQGANAGGADVDLWSWSYSCQVATQSPCPTGVFEFDSFEAWAPNSIGHSTFDMAMHEWGSGGGPYVINSTYPSPDTTKYHTYGLLTTTDGSTVIEGCGYIDHVLQGCSNITSPFLNNNPPNSGNFGQRNIFGFWTGLYYGFSGGPGSCVQYIQGDGSLGPGPQYCPNPGIHTWIKSIDVWSCADWNGTDYPGNTCIGPVIRN